MRGAAKRCGKERCKLAPEGGWPQLHEVVAGTTPPIYSVVQPPGTPGSIPSRTTTIMAGKRTVDVKISFEQFDMLPGAAGKMSTSSQRRAIQTKEHF